MNITIIYLIFLILGCLRGFTLTPATYLLSAGLLFIAPIPLFILSLISSIISASFIYSFTGSFHLYKKLEKKHKERIVKIKKSLEKNELLIVTGWNLAPLVPTDLISYVCGILKVDKKKFLIGTLVGQGIYIFIFIFLGKHLLSYFGL